jgi:hypothetical protein
MDGAGVGGARMVTGGAIRLAAGGVASFEVVLVPFWPGLRLMPKAIANMTTKNRNCGDPSPGGIAGACIRIEPFGSSQLIVRGVIERIVRVVIVRHERPPFTVARRQNFGA